LVSHRVSTLPLIVTLLMTSTRRRPAAKNWFDSEEDLDEAKSLHSDHSGSTGKDEEEGNPRESRHELKDRPSASGPGTRIEIMAGSESHAASFRGDKFSIYMDMYFMDCW